jgi:shikimate 5-dehydrogenase/shikimate kinase
LKLALVGHRGVGKSQLLKRLKNYLDDSVILLSLDKEIERRQATSLSEIFNTQGELAFRELEEQTLHQILKDHSSQSFVIDVGAGYQGSLPDELQVLWVKRAIDSSRSQFLDRPHLDGQLVMDSQRFQTRQKRYQDWSVYQLELLEHLNDSCPAEEFFFRALWEDNASAQPNTRLFSTLLHSQAWPRYELMARLTGCGVELRDDLIDHENIQRGLQKSNHSLLSFRDPNQTQWTEKLLKADSLWDWPLEWGKRKAPITSLHQRKDSLLETLREIEKVEGVAKLAIPIHNHAELKMGWDWAQEDLDKRVFLPSSEKGRWKGFRLLTAFQQKISFVRDGQGSSPDQPTLLEFLRWDPSLQFWAAILGKPVAHSLTPSQHHSFFKERRHNTLHWDLTESDWDLALPFLNEMGLRAAAVTSPLKTKARQLCSSFSAEDSHFNTLLFKENQWLGTNTDRHGFKKLVKGLQAEEVAVWGGGGTLAIIKELLPKASFYSSRTGEAREGPQPNKPSVIIWAVGFESFQNEGVYPPKDWTPRLVVDLNYTQDSPGIQCAHNYGCQYQSGLSMFIEQARKQQEFWSHHGI